MKYSNLLECPNHFLNPSLIFWGAGHPQPKIFSRGVAGDGVEKGEVRSRPAHFFITGCSPSPEVSRFAFILENPLKM